MLLDHLEIPFAIVVLPSMIETLEQDFGPSILSLRVKEEVGSGREVDFLKTNDCEICMLQSSIT